MSTMTLSAPAVQVAFPAWALRHAAQALRDDLSLLSGIISPALHARLADERAIVADLLEATDPGRCQDPDDLDPDDWPTDRTRYASADEWPDWTDLPIPYTLPPGELADYLSSLHGGDHDTQPDPEAIESWCGLSSDWHDWEAMYPGDDTATREEWDRKARARRS